VLFFVT